MSRYCVGPARHRPPEKVGLIVAHGGGLGGGLGGAVDPAGFERWTYGELAGAVGACARGLIDAGLRPGDRLVLRLPGQSTYPLLFFGAIAAGIIAVPTSSQLTPREFRFVVEDCRAAAVALEDADASPGPPVVTPEDVARWRRIHARDEGEPAYADTAADDPAFLVYTSGTTGSPKGVLHAQRSAWGRRPMYAGWYGLTASDVVLHAGALNWTYTLGVGLTDPWAVGATAVVYDGPRDPAIWPRLIEATGATIFAAVPGVYRQLLHSGANLNSLGSLRHGLTAGEALAPALRQEWLDATGRELYEALGMSEISTFVSSSPTTPSRAGSPGRPQPGRRIAVLPVLDDEHAESTPAPDVPLPDGETGLLAVHRSDPGLMLRYWERPEEDAASTRGEWFVSGDLVHLEPDGYLIHHGRDDDVMTSMGYRVSPLEVEAALTHHPAVAEAGCAEVEVREGVRVITAYVVLTPDATLRLAADSVADSAADVTRAPREGDSAATRFERNLIAHTHDELAAYKCPRRVVIVDALPRTANGKIRRRDLRTPPPPPAQPPPSGR